VTPPPSDQEPRSDAAPETSEDSLRNRPTALLAVKDHLFVVIEGDRPLAGGARFSLDDVDEVVIGRGDRRAVSREERDGVRRLILRLPAPSLSGLHARLLRGPAGWLLEDAHSRNGSYLNGQRVLRGEVGAADVLEVGRAILMIGSAPQRLDGPPGDLDADDLEREPPAFRTLIPADAARLDDLRRIARSTITVLLCGESGTGKEVLARSVHALSGRTGAFVAVNCGTLTEGLAESQLFGHVRGAFSGAVADSVGFVRAADGGTLLLDVVQDLGRAAQGALLRVLQEREVVPVGQARPQKVDVRFIATSPRALNAGVGHEQFRSDLFARLGGFVHTMTTLRQRLPDLGLLVAALLRQAGVREGAGARLGPEMGLRLVRYRWPLNVRELEQFLARSWLLADGGLMDGDPGAAGLGGPGAAGAGADAIDRRRVLSAHEQELRQRVIEALTTAGGNVSEAARALRKGRVQMHRLLKKIGVDPGKFRG
jgi:transcriptional regulator with AAA-type ATPase domain